MDNSSSAHTDQRYIEALLANDSVGIREIYERFAGRIAVFVRQNNGSTDDAKDIFQEALVAIARGACICGAARN